MQTACQEEGIMILQNIWNYLPNKKSHTTVNFESLATAVSEHQILDQKYFHQKRLKVRKLQLHSVLNITNGIMCQWFKFIENLLVIIWNIPVTAISLHRTENKRYGTRSTNLLTFFKVKLGRNTTTYRICHFLPGVCIMVRRRVYKTWPFCFFWDTLITTTSIDLSFITFLYLKYQTLSTYEHQQYEVTCLAKCGQHIVLAWKWTFNIEKLLLQLNAW